MFDWRIIAGEKENRGNKPTRIKGKQGKREIGKVTVRSEK